MDRITSAQQQMIVAAVRAGSFPAAAAASAGVPAPTVTRWLRRGRRQRSGRYRTFWLEVRQAQGQARVVAELDARNKDVKFWLRYGPGKLPPAWGPAGKRRPRSSGRQLQVETFALLGQLAQRLDDTSDARRQLLQMLEEMGGRGNRA